MERLRAILAAMGEPADHSAEFVQALVVEMLRAGIMPPAVIEGLALRFDAEERFYAGNSRSERYAAMAAAARAMLIEAQGETPAEFRAGRHRRRLHVVADGGKDPP